MSYRARKIADDFELRFQWKVGEGSNSGVYCRPSQYEYQILDNTKRIMDYAFASLGIQGIYCNNAEEWTSQLAPLKKLGLKLEPRPKGPVKKSSFQKDENGNPIEFIGCRMAITKEEWLRRAKQ